MSSPLASWLDGTGPLTRPLHEATGETLTASELAGLLHAAYISRDTEETWAEAHLEVVFDALSAPTIEELENALLWVGGIADLWTRTINARTENAA